ncbi:MAG TPA: DUF2190 family protein [Xanthobacteraceae bacterium]|nr:DUF2190 family protein [Xanthobacteraceae bacterium]
MKNFVNSGKVLELPAPTGGVVSGNCYKIGSLIAVAAVSAAQGELVNFERFGRYTLPKATGEVWAPGDLLYWNDTNKNFTKTAAGAVKAGIAVADAINGATVGEVVFVPTI